MKKNIIVIVLVIITCTFVSCAGSGKGVTVAEFEANYNSVASESINIPNVEKGKDIAFNISVETGIMGHTDSFEGIADNLKIKTMVCTYSGYTDILTPFKKQKVYDILDKGGNITVEEITALSQVVNLADVMRSFDNAFSEEQAFDFLESSNTIVLGGYTFSNSFSGDTLILSIELN